MLNQTLSMPTSWLGFELNILRRLEFQTAAMPFSPNPALGLHLKRRGVRVLANDSLQAGWTRALAAIQNNVERLTDEDVNTILEDVYIPRHKLNNSALRNWFNETDAWWFDNVRKNLDKVASPFAFAIGASLAMAVGDYARSFTAETLELRQPLSNTFRRLWMMFPEPVNNGQNNTCQNKDADEFIAESFAELMFLRLPSAVGGRRQSTDAATWREEWLRGGNDFWADVEHGRNGRLGSPVATKSQYLKLIEETLRTASHIPKWAIAHVESGFVSTQEIVEVVGQVRRVETIFSKDFTELCGTKAIIITA